MPDGAPARERPEGPTPRVTHLAGAAGMPSPVDLAAQNHIDRLYDAGFILELEANATKAAAASDIGR